MGCNSVAEPSKQWPLAIIFSKGRAPQVYFPHGFETWLQPVVRRGTSSVLQGLFHMNELLTMTMKFDFLGIYCIHPSGSHLEMHHIKNGEQAFWPILMKDIWLATCDGCNALHPQENHQSMWCSINGFQPFTAQDFFHFSDSVRQVRNRRGSNYAGTMIGLFILKPGDSS